jgi:carboxyl-terminal processing protease
MNRQDYFNKFKTPAEFVSGFRDSTDAWNRLVAFMKNENVNIENLPAADRREVEKRIKTWMARQLWRMQGYYEVHNQYDQAVIRALAEVKKQPA